MKLSMLFSVILIALPIAKPQTMQATKLFKQLEQYCKTLPEEFNQIPNERKEVLEALGRFISEKRLSEKDATVTVICTHNSRRSQMAQLWISAASIWYGIPVNAFSGGVEKTAFHPNAVAALVRAGFKIEKVKGVENPVYQATYGKSLPAKLLFSKKYDDSVNPKQDFAAVMVCSEADASCPVVPGAAERFSLPFEDPRYFDKTAAETEKYDETCRLIARDFFYAMYYAKQQLILDEEKKKSKR